jgi:hypothetical protein
MENEPPAINSLKRPLLSAFAEALSTSKRRQSNAKKKSSDDRNQEKLQKKMRQATLDVVARNLFEAKENNGGRMPHQEIQKAIESCKTVGIITNRFKLGRQVEKIEHNQQQPVASVLANNDAATVSPLTNTASNQGGGNEGGRTTIVLKGM